MRAYCLRQNIVIYTRYPSKEGMGFHLSIAHFHSSNHQYYLVALSNQTNNSLFHISSPSSLNVRLSTSRRKQRPRKLVAENNGGASEKEQGKTTTTETKTRNNGFWSNFRIRQKKPTKVEKDGNPDVFWNSLFSGKDEDLQDIGPVQIRLLDLLDPDPQNMLTLAFTGLLTLAAFQILWQLFFVSLAIFVAALKYSLLATILLFIIVTLL